MARRFSAARCGLTLIELVVVIAILAALTMILIPKLDGLQGQANHAAAAASVADTARYIQMYNAKKSGTAFPNGWDSLAVPGGTSLWSLADPATKTKGLHPTAFASSGKFTSATLTQADVDSLTGIGIKTFYHVTTSLPAATRPGDMFTTEAPIAESNTVAIPNPATSGGKKIIDHVYRVNLKTGGTSGAIPSGRKLIALGFGPLNELVGTLALECPVYANVDATLVYNRNLALFEVGGSKAIFKGVVASDGDLQDDLSTYMNRDL